MAYSQLKADIVAVIKQNGNNEITGNILQQILLEIVTQMPQADFLGVATPTTNPGNPDGGAVYLAGTPGTYVNFGTGFTLQPGQIAVIRGSGSTWFPSYIDTVAGYAVYNSHMRQTAFAAYGTMQAALNAVPAAVRRMGTRVIFSHTNGNWYELTKISGDTSTWVVADFNAKVIAGAYIRQYAFPIVSQVGATGQPNATQSYALSNSKFVRDMPNANGVFVSDYVAQIALFGYTGMADTNPLTDLGIVSIGDYGTPAAPTLHLSYIAASGNRTTVTVTNYDAATKTFIGTLAGFKIKVVLSQYPETRITFDTGLNIIAGVPSGYSFAGLFPENPLIVDTVDNAGVRTSDYIADIKIENNTRFAVTDTIKTLTSAYFAQFVKGATPAVDTLRFGITINGSAKPTTLTRTSADSMVFTGVLNNWFKVTVTMKATPADTYTFPTNKINVALFRAACYVANRQRMDGYAIDNVRLNSVVGYLDQTTGGITPYPNQPTRQSIVSDFIPIDWDALSAGKKMFIYRTERYCFYTAANESSFISGTYIGVAGTVSVAPPANAMYIRANTVQEYDPAIVFLENENQIGKEYIDDLTLSPDSALAIKQIAQFETLGYKMATEKLITSQDAPAARQYIKPDTGVLTASSGIYRTTAGFIAITPGGKISAKYVRSFAFYSAANESTYITGSEYIPAEHSVINIPNNATFVRVSMYSDWTDESMNAYFVEGDQVPQFGKYELTNLASSGGGGGGTAGTGTTYAAIKAIAPETNPKGEAVVSTEMPDENNTQFNDAYVVGENGVVLGVDAEVGDLLVYAGGFNRLRRNIAPATDVKQYDVVIIGAGTGGIGTAYALKDAGKSVVMVDKLTGLGGTACQSWVDTWIEGCPPLYFVTLFNEMKAAGDVTGDIENFYLPPKFAAGTGSGLNIPFDKLPTKYEADLNGKIDFMLNTEFVAIAEVKGRIVTGVFVRNRETGVTTLITGKYFVDASGDGVLCRSANGIAFTDYFYGQDARNLYNESIAPLNPSKMTLNEPSLFFKILNGYDDSALLATITTVYRTGDGVNDIVRPDYVYPDGYPGRTDSAGNRIVNPMTGCTRYGGRINILDGGDLLTEEVKRQRILEYWKFTKIRLQLYYENYGDNYPVGGWNTSQRNFGFVGLTADYIGIRESYRIKCDTMLNQNDLAVLISSSALGNAIANGSHSVDYHIRTGLDTAALTNFNDNLLRPYAIQYGSIIPEKLDNVLIASRCYGASQVALASARVNVVLAQLGWAAGNAIKYLFDNNKSNVRDVDVVALQSDAYTGFKSQVVKLESKLKSGL